MTGEHQIDGTIVIEKDGSGNLVIKNINSTTTGELNATNETYVHAARGSDSSSTASATYINVFDSEVDDARGEFNTSQEFVPDRSGTYEFELTCRIEGNTTETDTINYRLQNKTDNKVVAFDEKQATDSIFQSGASLVGELTAGKKYAVQVQNVNSSFVVSATNTAGFIKRWVSD